LSLVRDMPGQPRAMEDFAWAFLIRVWGFNFCAEFGSSASGGGHGEALVGWCRLLQCWWGGNGIFCWSSAGAGGNGIFESAIAVGLSTEAGAEHGGVGAETSALMAHSRCIILAQSLSTIVVRVQRAWEFFVVALIRCCVFV